MFRPIYTIESEEVPFKKFLLNFLMQKFSDYESSTDPKIRQERAREIGKLTIDYLKATKQHNRQFELCIKTFDGSDSTSFDSDFEESIKILYQDHVEDLADNLIQFSKDNIHPSNFRIFEIGLYEPQSFERLYREYFFKYIDSESKNGVGIGDPLYIRRVRIGKTTDTALNLLEGKLRTIGQFTCINDAIRFIKVRIGINKDNKYKFKSLVNDLDELIDNLLINSSTNEINKVKAQEDVTDLVKEGMREYEVTSKPKYLIDRNLFRTALTKKIDNLLNRE